MRDGSSDGLIECELCEAVLDPNVDRVFQISDDLVLCPSCASLRGGVYDEERDSWVRFPEVADLVVAEP